jgi:enoyl-CoA hydratase/carnithine racemase
VSEALVEEAALYSVQDGVAVVTLNRPSAMNAVNSALATAVGERLEEAAQDPAVRVIVLTGSGRAFCAGADLKELAQGRSIDAVGHPEWGFGGVAQHWIPKPVIGAVNGFALGGGTELALACDLVVASAEAKFGLPEVKRGLMAAAGGVIRLQRQIPLKRALYLALTGEPIDAATAADWGIVTSVVPTEEVLPAALELARVIAANAPLSLEHTKRMLHLTSSGSSDWDGGEIPTDPWAANRIAMDVVFTSRDAVEGPTAFAEKRPPHWEGQ